MAPGATNSSVRGPKLRLALIALVLSALAIAAAGSGLSVSEAREVLGAGGISMVAFVFLYAALTVAMFPGSALSLAAGALFGTALGTLLTVAGATLGATLAFLLARRLSRPALEAIAGPRLRRVDARLSGHRIAPILVLRLIPLVPFNVLNYAAGATAMRGRHYVTGTLLGILPGSFALSAAGAAAADEPASLAFAGALGLVALLAIGGAIGARRLSGAAL